eukprot:symbB.v1.2.024842.t1/scaffold2378.1/size80641/1
MASAIASWLEQLRLDLLAQRANQRARWLHRTLDDLPVDGEDRVCLLGLCRSLQLSRHGDGGKLKKQALIEKLSSKILEQLPVASAASAGSVDASMSSKYVSQVRAELRRQPSDAREAWLKAEMNSMQLGNSLEGKPSVRDVCRHLNMAVADRKGKLDKKTLVNNLVEKLMSQIGHVVDSASASSGVDPAVVKGYVQMLRVALTQKEPHERSSWLQSQFKALCHKNSKDGKPAISCGHCSDEIVPVSMDAFMGELVDSSAAAPGLDMSVCEEFVSKLLADAAEQIADERCFWCAMQLAPLDLTNAHDDRPSLQDLCRYLELDAGGMDRDGVIDLLSDRLSSQAACVGVAAVSSLDMLLAACASIADVVPSMGTLRGTFTTRAQTISACCLLSGDSEEKARNCHYSHEHWLGVLEHSVTQLAEAVALFADVLPRKAPEKIRNLTATVVPAWHERVVSKMWSEGLRQTALTLVAAETWIEGGWHTLLGSKDSKVVFDAFGKAALACVMRAYGFELISGASACVFWQETYDWIFKTGYASEAAAWTLLVDVLRDRQRPADWQHHPEIVKSRRCSEQGISSEAATLRVAIEHWQEETGNAGLPTTDQHRQLRLRIDKYLRADLQQKRKKALETRYPLDYRHTDPAGDWPGREEDDLEPGAWRSAAERKVMFSLRGWSEASQAELKLYVPTLAVVEGCDESARDALRSLECVDASFQQRLQQVARAWDVTPTMHGAAEAIAKRLLQPLDVEEDTCWERYPCRLCSQSFESISDFRQHVQGQHSAVYADDMERAYVEYRKKAGTQKLLPLVRTCIQVTILQGSGLHSSERQRGLIGNSIFLPQASPSQVQRVLPPSAETLQEHFSFVLVDAEKKNIDCAPLLETSHARYAAAVKCLNELSPYYQDVDVAVERLGDDGLAPALLDCVLETSADSALAQRLLQSGPADAQGQDLEEEQQDGAPVAHATEEGKCVDRVNAAEEVLRLRQQNDVTGDGEAVEGAETLLGREGHRSQIRHRGHAAGWHYGNATLFVTPNLADTRASLLLQLHGKQYQLSGKLDDGMPELETANEMRRILASDPVAQAKFFNLMMQLFFTQILGISEPLQREFLPTFGTQYHEDGFASTTFGGCFGDVGYVMGPIETQ